MKPVLIGVLSIFLNTLALADNAATVSTPPIAKASFEGVNGIARIIPQLSFNLSSFTGSDVNAENKVGYGLGVTMDVGKLSDKTVIESGLLYRHFGTELTNGSLTTNLEAGYVSIPLLLKYYARPEVAHSFYFKGGIIPGVLADSSAQHNTSKIPLNNFDLELALGIGGKFKISDSHDFFLEATYNHGLTNVIDTGSNPSSPAYNAAFLVTGGLGFNL